MLGQLDLLSPILCQLPYSRSAFVPYLYKKSQEILIGEVLKRKKFSEFSSHENHLVEAESSDRNRVIMAEPESSDQSRLTMTDSPSSWPTDCLHGWLTITDRPSSWLTDRLHGRLTIFMVDRPSSWSTDRLHGWLTMTNSPSSWPINHLYGWSIVLIADGHIYYRYMVG